MKVGRKMKICFLGDGNSVHIKRWLEYFRDKDHEVHIITFSDCICKGIHIHKIEGVDSNINGNNYKYIFKVGQIKKILGMIKPDIINAHYITSYGFLASLTGHKNIVMSAWGSDILVTPKKNSLYKLITKYALSKARLITSDSEFMSDEIKKLTHNTVITVPMGVEESLCTLERKETKNIEIVSLRTINKNSNIDIIVKAFARISESKKYKNIRLIIVNSGPEIENIKNMVENLNLQNTVEIKGFVEREEIINLLRSAFVYVSIPFSDSTSVTLLEAMACGTLCIVSDIPANREWINKNNGYILEKNNDEELSIILQKALDNVKFKNETSDLNRKVISSKALWKNNMLNVESEFLNIAKENKNRRM